MDSETKKILKGWTIDLRAYWLVRKYIAEFESYINGILAEQPVLFCPVCLEKMDFQNDKWQCLYRCPVRFPKAYEPPSPRELENFFKAKKFEKKINDIMGNKIEPAL